MTPSWPVGDGGVEERLGLLGRVGLTSRAHAEVLGHDGVEPREAVGVGDSIRESPSSSSRSKKNGRMPVAPLRVAVVDAVSWKGRGRPVGVERERLAVEDQVGGRQRPRPAATTSGSRAAISSRTAGEDRDLVAVLVDLDPDAVELGVDGEPAPADLVDAGGDVGCGAGQHRAHRAADHAARTPRAPPRRRSSAAAAIGPVGALNIAARRTAWHGQLGGLGDGVEHHRVERALADVAGDQRRAGSPARRAVSRPNSAATAVAPGARRARAGQPGRAPRARRRPRSGVTEGSAAGGGQVGQSERQPTPVRRWRSVPER